MLPSLFIVATLTAPGAPIPLETSPNPTGAAPRILAVKANPAGMIIVTAIVHEKQKQLVPVAVNQNGNPIVKMEEREVAVTRVIQKELTDLGRIVLADGTSLSAEQATRRVKDGATILVSADGKPVERGWLRAVSGDAVILITDELANAQFSHSQPGLPATPPPRLVMLACNEKGTVRLPVNPQAGTLQQIYSNDPSILPNGGAFQNVQAFRPGGGMIVVNGQLLNLTDNPSVPVMKPADSDGKKALDDIRFDAFTLSGQRMPRATALQRLRAGGLVLLASDNRMPDEQYLKVFHEDMIILVSAELAFPFGQPNPYDHSGKPLEAANRIVGGAGAGLPLIAPARVPVLPAAPGAPAAIIQIKPVPVVPVLPVPAAPQTPAPAANGKPQQAVQNMDPPVKP